MTSLGESKTLDAMWKDTEYEKADKALRKFSVSLDLDTKEISFFLLSGKLLGFNNNILTKLKSYTITPIKNLSYYVINSLECLLKALLSSF